MPKPLRTSAGCGRDGYRRPAAERRRRRSTRRQDGAAAVEFALVLPLLLALVFGILDFGFWFNESLNVRHGVREAARQGIVQRLDHPDCATAPTSMEQLACTTRAEIRPVTGTAYARVVVPAAGWKRGERLVVCGMVATRALSGITPLPADGLVRSAAAMSIERDSATAFSASPGPHGDPAPSGADWAWCS